MLSFAEPNSPLREPATVWLLNRMSNDWADYGLRPALKAAGIYDPDTIDAEGSRSCRGRRRICRSSRSTRSSGSPETPRAARTRPRAARCATPSAAPAPSSARRSMAGASGKSADVIATAIVRPSAEIAHGYEGAELKTKDGLTIQGVLIKEGDPLMMRSMGGITQIIPGRPRRLAPADAGIADDERRAAGPHRPGRRRPRRRSCGPTDSGFRDQGLRD